MKTEKSCVHIYSVLAIAALATVACGDVKLPSFFGSNMVLQQGQGTTISGKASPGEKVSVTVGSMAPVTTVTGEQGSWAVTLPEIKAQSESVDVVIQGNNKIVLNNVLIGDVWVGSGQSNMEYSVVRTTNGQEEVDAANYPELRLFQVKKIASLKPLDNVQGEWKVCSPATVKNFSAVLYYFGRDLQKQIHKPVGLVAAAWSGTRIQAWSLPEVLLADEYNRSQMAEEAARLDNPEWIRKENESRMAKWTQEAEKAKAAGSPEPRKPKVASQDDSNRCCVLYYGMIAPLTAMKIKGIAWYQAENNSGAPANYAQLFAPMITSWRGAWHQPELPFVFVQLPNWLSLGTQADPVDTLWTRTREAQATALTLPYTGMAVTIDVGEAGDIHPKNKQVVGQRLMLAALKTAYGDTRTTSPGPIFSSMSQDGNNIRIKFKNTGEGLVLQDQRPLTGFSVAGADRVFKTVTGVVENDSVILDCGAIKAVQAVRYAWSDDPQANLYNKEGLPAAPFRTDDWPRNTPAK